MTAQAGVAEGIPAGSAMRCCQMKRRVGYGNVSETVDSTAIGFARGLSSVATIAGITTVCDRVFARGVIDGGCAEYGKDSAALGHSTKSTIPVSILIDATTVAAGGCAVFNARALDVEGPILEVNRSAFRVGAAAIVEVAAVAALR